MKIQKINTINYNHKIAKTNNFTMPKVSFCGNDEFIKNAIPKTYKEASDILIHNETTLMNYKMRDVSTIISDEIRSKYCTPLTHGKYSDVYQKYLEFTKKDGPMRHVWKILDDMMENVEKFAYEFSQSVDKYNGMAIVSKDKKMAQDVFDFFPHYMKLQSERKKTYLEGKEGYWYNPYESCFKIDFIDINPEKKTRTLLLVLYMKH